MLAVALAAPARAIQPKISSAGRIGLFTPDWKTFSDRTDAQWTSMAKRFALLIGTKLLYRDHLDEIRAANPNATILLYNLGPYLQNGSDNYNDVMANHPDWFAHDEDGNLINVKTQTDMTLMDQGNANWRAYHVAYVKDYVDTFGFDGLQLDCMGWGPIKGYTSAVPIDNTTGQPYTVTKWLQLSVTTLNAMKDALGPARFVAFNGLANGFAYSEATKVLATSKADGGTAEGFVRDALDPIDRWPSVQEWLLELKMMKDMQAKGKAFFGWTKTWVTATDAQRANWNTFALGTYLLAKGDHAYYNFLPSTAWDRSQLAYPNMTSKLGPALGDYTVTRGIYSRRFKNGSVRVDPAHHSATISVAN